MTASAPTLTIAVPVYRSAAFLGRTIDRIATAMTSADIDYEIVLVDDGSADGTFEVIRDYAMRNVRVRGLRLDRNHGQSTALLCALDASRGDWIAGMDDDLQNPPEEIARLLVAAQSGHDLVFGRFRVSGQPLWRQVASRGFRLALALVARRPPGLVTSNMFLVAGEFARAVVRGSNGWAHPVALLLRQSRSPTNVWVEHSAANQGGSRYRLRTLLLLAARILCHHSALSPMTLSVAAHILSVGLFLSALYSHGIAAVALAAGGALLGVTAAFCFHEAHRPAGLAHARVAGRCGDSEGHPDAARSSRAL